MLLLSKWGRNRFSIITQVFIQRKIFISFPVGPVNNSDKSHLYFAQIAEEYAGIHRPSSFAHDKLTTRIIICIYPVHCRVFCLVMQAFKYRAR